jgi:hypothetical protein
MDSDQPSGVTRLDFIHTQRNYPQGAEYTARLAKDAGFGRVDVIPIAGRPAVFATLASSGRDRPGRVPPSSQPHRHLVDR